MYKITGRLATKSHVTKLVNELNKVEFEGKPRYSFKDTESIIDSASYKGATEGKSHYVKVHHFEFNGKKFTIMVNTTKERLMFVPTEVSELSLKNVDRVLKGHIASFAHDAASIPVMLP